MSSEYRFYGISDEDREMMSKLFKDDVRKKILAQLDQISELNVTTLAKLLSMNVVSLRSHLTLLRLNNVIQTRHAGEHIYYSLTADGKQLFKRYLLIQENLGDDQQSSLKLYIDPGTATPDDLAELFFEISRLYRMVGGAGIEFRVTDVRDSSCVEGAV